jgi:arsenate reductase (thioredoxin)
MRRKWLWPLAGLLLTLGIAMGAACFVREDTRLMKRIIFVCVENSNRSQMAEAFARIHGKVEAYSAGSRPSGMVNPMAVEAMQELGYDLTQHRSKSLADLGNVDFDVAVTMGCGDECPHIRAKHREDWQIPDPKNLPLHEFRQVRDTIEEKVKQLLASL